MPDVIRLGEYEILGRLAVGGMAEVYLGRWSRMGAERLVVIKRVLPHLVEDRDFIRMFEQEVKVSAALEHPNVVRIYDADVQDGLPFLVMEYMDGGSLKEFVNEFGTVDAGQLAGIAAEICKGLNFAHGMNPPIIHRDISPHNVLLTRGGLVKVSDFGIAKAVGSASMTKTGVLKGKLAYMAPEQLATGNSGPASDQFAAGITLYECATGLRAYGDASDIELLKRVSASDWNRNAPEWQAIDVDLRSIVEKMLDTDPGHRWPTMRDAQRAFERLLAAHSEDWQDELATKLAVRSATVPKAIDPTLTTGFSVVRTEQLDQTTVDATSQMHQPGNEQNLEPTLTVDIFPVQSGRGWSTTRIGLALIGGFAIAVAAVWLLPGLATVSPVTPAASGPDVPPETGSSVPDEPGRSTQKPLAPRPDNGLDPGQNAALDEPPTGPVAPGGAEPTPGGQDPNGNGTSNNSAIEKPQPPRRATAQPAAVIPAPLIGTPSVSETGKILIQVLPWANVIIDGRPVGSTPILDHELATGDHIVELENTGINWRTRKQVAILPGETHRIVIDLEQTQ